MGCREVMIQRIFATATNKSNFATARHYLFSAWLERAWSKLGDGAAHWRPFPGCKVVGRIVAAVWPPSTPFDAPYRYPAESQERLLNELIEVIRRRAMRDDAPAAAKIPRASRLRAPKRCQSGSGLSRVSPEILILSLIVFVFYVI